MSEKQSKMLHKVFFTVPITKILGSSLFYISLDKAVFLTDESVLNP